MHGQTIEQLRRRAAELKAKADAHPEWRTGTPEQRKAHTNWLRGYYVTLDMIFERTGA